MTPNRRKRGFTLIELMVAVVIVGILAAIAYPSYKNYILKGHRSSAQAFLMDAAQRQQQYFLDNRTFAPDVTTLFGTASAVPSEVDPYYNISINTTADPPPPTFVITATPKGTQAANNEQAMTINQLGDKQPPTYW